MTELKWIACMFHISVTEFDFIEECLKSYDIGGYMIGSELVPYEHYHILFQGTDKIYSAFSKRLVVKYKLRGRATKDKPRQYGKLNQIKDIEKLKSYTIKDGNYRSNLSQEELDSYFMKSYKKKDNADTIDLIVQDLDSFAVEIFHNTSQRYFADVIKELIIRFCLKNDVKISRPFVNNTVTRYLAKTTKLTQDEKVKYIFNYIN